MYYSVLRMEGICNNPANDNDKANSQPSLTQMGSWRFTSRQKYAV